MCTECFLHTWHNPGNKGTRQVPPLAPCCNGEAAQRGTYRARQALTTLGRWGTVSCDQNLAAWLAPESLLSAPTLQAALYNQMR